jgi:hypothetical protein
MLLRRHCLAALPAAALWALRSSARARSTPQVTVGAIAVGAIVDAECGSLVTLTVGDVGPTAIRIGDGPPIDVAARIRRKGRGPARDRILDDARNATRVGASIRDALVSVDASLAEPLAQRHRAWARPFARRVLAWSKRLEAGPLAGTAVADPHGRIYLLEWASARVDAGAGAPPAALAHAPGEPSAPTLAAYEAYIEALVAVIAPAT